MTEIQYLSGKRNSLADVDGFLVGNSHDETLKSGVTMYIMKNLHSCVSCNGRILARETELLAPIN